MLPCRMVSRSSVSHAAQSGRRTKRRFDVGVTQFAWAAGWLGTGLLLVCALLWMLPRSGGVPAESLVPATVGALLLASLVGWGFVNEGQNAVARRFPPLVGFLAFFALPLSCGLIGLFEAAVSRATGFAPPNHPFWLFVTWYPPLLVMSCAAVYFKRQAWPRSRLHLARTLWVLLLFVPYALLFGYLVLHLRIDALADPLHETLGKLGQYGLIVQILLAFFVGSPAR